MMSQRGGVTLTAISIGFPKQVFLFLSSLSIVWFRLEFLSNNVKFDLSRAMLH